MYKTVKDEVERLLNKSDDFGAVFVSRHITRVTDEYGNVIGWTMESQNG